MQVTEIVKDWLKSHGYDGLYTDDCGCRIADLAPCGGEGMSECCAGVYKPCDPATGYDYFIGPKDPPPEDSGAGEHISQHSNGAEPSEITASCKWGLDMCPFDVAHKQCSTCRCDRP